MGPHIYRPGDIVVAVDENIHWSHPEWFPAPGCKGEVTFSRSGSAEIRVRWEPGSVPPESEDCSWYVLVDWVAPLEEEEEDELLAENADVASLLFSVQ